MKQTDIAESNPAEILNPQDAAHAEKLRKFGISIIRKTGEVASLFCEMVIYIRENAVAPKLVNDELTRLGFHKVRISEIKRVAFAGEGVFKLFEAKTIGFDRALLLARKEGDEKLSTEAAQRLLKDKVLTDEELKETLSADEAAQPAAQRVKVREAVKIAQAAELIMMKSKRAKQWTNGKWILELRKAE